MRELRVFISSPGDVGREREIAARVLLRLAVEVSGVARVESYLWEHEPMRGSADFQEQIDSPADFDIFVCILWSRLGSRLSDRYSRSDGSAFASGDSCVPSMWRSPL